MKRAGGLLGGAVEAEIECRWPERVLNLCAMNGVAYRELRRAGEHTLIAELSVRDYRRLRLLSKEGGFAVRVVKKSGAPFFLWRIRGRWALWGILPLCVLAVWASSFFILEIGVSGNETVPSGVILAELEELGVGIGTMRLSIPMERVANEMLLRVPELSWIAVNCTGSRAEVLVREERPAPALYDKGSPADILAKKPGVITKMTILEGARVKNVGDTVDTGDLLVSGRMTSLLSGGRDVRALGEVTARTWYELEAKAPLYAVEKRPTGRQTARTALVFAGKRLNFYFNGGNPYAYCDKIILEKKLTLFRGAVLPLTLVRETFREYAPEPAAMDEKETEALLRERLRAALERRLDQGEIVSTSFAVSKTADALTVAMSAECSESIGVTREYDTREERQDYGGEDRGDG